MNIDWFSDQSHILAPRKNSVDQPSLKDWPDFPNHVWILTSGSDGRPKWVGHSKNSFLNSARAVNSHLGVVPEDKWLNVLPTSHVGGLAIYARARIEGNEVVDRSHFKWDPLEIVRRIDEERISLTSMVPTQVYDLVDLELSAPESLRAVVVGGGHLTPSLYQKARALGWPVLPSYGMTETCSQVATAALESLAQTNFPSLQVLQHAEIQNRESVLWIKSESLLSGYMVEQNGKWELVDPKIDGWFKSTDIGEEENGYLKNVARESCSVKVKGELVSISEIENLWQRNALSKKIHARIHWMAVPHSRDENQIIAICDHKSWLEIQGPWTDFVQSQLMPLQRPLGFYGLVDFPQDPMGKWPKEKIRRLLGF